MRHPVLLLVLPALLAAAEPDTARPTGSPADSIPPDSVVLSAPEIARLPLVATPSDPDATRAPTPLVAGTASLLVPGLGQWLTGHPVRGSLLGVLELWLYGDALQRCLTGIPDLRTERDLLREQVRQEESAAQGDSSAATTDRLADLRDDLSVANGSANISTDYVHSEIAWATGVHVWGVVDAAEAAWIRRGGVRPVRGMSEAAWASALVPGLGQIRNGRYSKAALLYMAVAGSVVSLDGRQGMVEFWKTEANLARAQGRSPGYAQEQADFFRKRRNQYVWGLGLLYVYQILDATVDARLSRIGSAPTFTLSPSIGDPGLTATLSF